VSQLDPPVVVPAGSPGQTRSERVHGMFSRIVARYDGMNRLMTFGLDGGWRRAAAQAVGLDHGLALDVGTGTGDLAVALANCGANQVIGADFVGEMLAVARAKVNARSIVGSVSLVGADALRLPFRDETFDGVVNGFLLRNVADLPAVLRELVRVLKPGGRLVCLEITHPAGPLAPFLGLYFARVVPRLGALVTGEGAAYEYLPASLGPLPDVQRLAGLLVAAGLVSVRYRRLGLGTVALHVGQKP
jgi:demethylmenaquinone methyltransferase / 2-methoxy-6-polyprenyl-1,4-benzoquinol methylase